jgi:hypothetical protein
MNEQSQFVPGFQPPVTITESPNPVSIEAQRDVALAVQVLVNDLELDSDEALALLVEQQIIPARAARLYRERYFRLVKHLRPLTDRVRSAQLASEYDDVPPSGSTRGV